MGTDAVASIMPKRSRPKTISRRHRTCKLALFLCPGPDHSCAATFGGASNSSLDTGSGRLRPHALVVLCFNELVTIVLSSAVVLIPELRTPPEIV
jgi:hypothetical protein